MTSDTPAVYLSYSAPDRRIAVQVARHLRRCAVRSSLDVLDARRRADREIAAGEVLPESVLEELDQSTVVVAVWTASAAHDPWVAAELEMAEAIGVEVVCLVSAPDAPDVPTNAASAGDLAELLDDLVDGGCSDWDGPDGSIELSPGRWTITGTGVSDPLELDLELGEDGRLRGVRRRGATAQDVVGSWHVDEGDGVVEMRVASSFGSAAQVEVVRIEVTSVDGRTLFGRDAYRVGLGVRSYVLRPAHT